MLKHILVIFGLILFSQPSTTTRFQRTTVTLPGTRIITGLAIPECHKGKLLYKYSLK